MLQLIFSLLVLLVSMSGPVMKGNAAIWRSTLTAEETGTALARQLGQAGEDAVGITGPKTAIEIPGSGQIRIPDALTDTNLNLTRQP